MSRVILSLENRTWETVQPEIQFRAGGRQDSLQLRPYDSAAPHFSGAQDGKEPKCGYVWDSGRQEGTRH